MPVTAAELEVKYGADTSGAVQGAKQVDAAVTKTTSGMAAQFKAASSSISAGFHQLGSIARSVFTGSLILGGLQVLTDKTIAYGETIQRTSVLTGLSAQASARLSMETTAAGSSVDVLTKRFLVLDKAAAPVNGKLSSTGQTLQLLGVQLTDQSGKLLPLNDQLQNVATAYANAGDKAQFMANVFGPRGAALAPLVVHFEELQKATQGLHFPVPTESEIIRLSLMQQHLQLLEVSIGQKILPFFTNLTGALAKFADDLTSGKGLTKALGDLWHSLGTGQKILVSFIAAITAGKLLSALSSIASGLKLGALAAKSFITNLVIGEGSLAGYAGALAVVTLGAFKLGEELGHLLVQFLHLSDDRSFYAAIGALRTQLESGTISLAEFTDQADQLAAHFHTNDAAVLQQAQIWATYGDAANAAAGSMDAINRADAALDSGLIKVGKTLDRSGHFVSVFAGLMGKALKSWEGGAVQAVSGVTGAFANLDSKGKVTVGDLNSYLTTNTKDLHKWSDDLQALIRSGAPAAFVKWFIDLGPSTLPALDKLVHGSDTALAATERNFQRHQAGIAAYKKLLESLPRLVETDVVTRYKTIGVPGVTVPGPHPRAAGGIIDEPVMGIGLRTGTSWSFGEHGDEWVTPGGHPPAGGTAGGLAQEVARGAESGIRKGLAYVASRQFADGGW